MCCYRYSFKWWHHVFILTVTVPSFYHVRNGIANARICWLIDSPTTYCFNSILVRLFVLLFGNRPSVQIWSTSVQKRNKITKRTRTSEGGEGREGGRGEEKVGKTQWRTNIQFWCCSLVVYQLFQLYGIIPFLFVNHFCPRQMQTLGEV